jgi:hypothetical protein
MLATAIITWSGFLDGMFARCREIAHTVFWIFFLKRIFAAATVVIQRLRLIGLLIRGPGLGFIAGWHFSRSMTFSAHGSSPFDSLEDLSRNHRANSALNETAQVLPLK